VTVGGAGARPVATAAEAADPRLTGRTYAIPFEQVWRAALGLAEGGLRRWRLLAADDQEGLIRAEIHPLLLGPISDVTVHIGLDADAQTRVDAEAASRAGRPATRTHARRIGRFFATLDRALARRP
jgi:hypothetical protein